MTKVTMLPTRAASDPDPIGCRAPHGHRHKHQRERQRSQGAGHAANHRRGSLLGPAASWSTERSTRLLSLVNLPTVQNASTSTTFRQAPALP
jgi:hypothetical protein